YSVDKKTERYLLLRFNPNKKKSQSINNCSLFTIDTKAIMQNSGVERLFKSSTYYLENTHIRLPYMPNTTELFIVEHFNDADALEKLFNNGINFNKYHSEEKQITIIKRYPIPKLTKKIMLGKPVICY